MTLAPRFLLNFWAGFRVATFVRRLKSLDRGVGAQQKIFTHLMARFAQIEFGRAQGLTARTPYAQFHERVAPRTYKDFEPLIQRMVAGEAGVLTPERCIFFVETAGTTGDGPKRWPVPAEMLKHYRRGLNAALYTSKPMACGTTAFFSDDTCGSERAQPLSSKAARTGPASMAC